MPDAGAEERDGSRPSVDVDGLLVEGVDYAGKTTVLDLVQARLATDGRRVFRRACFMNEHPIIDDLLALAKTSDSMAVRDTCYTASLLLDLSLPSLPQDGFLLQERHVETQIGRNTFFYRDPERWHVAQLVALRRRFEVQVYLTSNLEAKRARTRARPPKSPRDALLAADPALHQAYDDYMRGSLGHPETWSIIDTSGLDAQGVADVIVDLVERRSAALARAHPAVGS